MSIRQDAYEKYSKLIGSNIVKVRVLNWELELKLSGKLNMLRNEISNYMVAEFSEYWRLDDNGHATYITTFELYDRSDKEQRYEVFNCCYNLTMESVEIEFMDDMLDELSTFTSYGVEFTKFIECDFKYFVMSFYRNLNLTTNKHNYIYQKEF